MPASSAAAVLGRKRPLKMSAAAAAATAAAAVAAAIARFTVPGNSAFRIHRPRSPEGLASLSSSRSDDSASERGGDGGDALGMRQLLISMMRWVLTGGRLGMRRPTVGKAGFARGVSGVNIVLQGLLVKMWPFSAAGAGGPTSLASKGGGSGGGGGEDGDPIRRQGGRAAVRPTASQQAQYKYPRPQSTAYPRPQSTAYPRPKVTVPTLLNLEEVEEAAEVRPRKQQLAAASWTSSAAATAKAAAKDKEGEDGNPLLSKFLCWFFARMITKRAKLVEGLEVHVDARSNRDAMSGLLQAVGITFNHLVLENVEISGGATMRITGLDLKVTTLLWRRFRSFKRPFEVSRGFRFFCGV